MAAVKGSDTSLERKVHAAFQARRWKYERNVASLPGKPDFVFHSEKVAVFVDGYFWHGWRFPQWQHKVTAYWQSKIAKNRQRDRLNFQRLRRRGWKVLRFWSHQVDKDLDAVVAEVAKFVARNTKCKS